MMEVKAQQQKIERNTQQPAGTIVEDLQQFDVLLGRGIGPNEHPGNIRYRTIVRAYQSEYLATKKRKEKERTASKTIKMVQANGARFLKRLLEEEPENDSKDLDTTRRKENSEATATRYVVVEEEAVLEKTKQALRFQGHNKHLYSRPEGIERDEDSTAKSARQYSPVSCPQQSGSYLVEKSNISLSISSSPASSSPENDDSIPAMLQPPVDQVSSRGQERSADHTALLSALAAPPTAALLSTLLSQPQSSTMASFLGWISTSPTLSQDAISSLASLIRISQVTQNETSFAAASIKGALSSILSAEQGNIDITRLKLLAQAQVQATLHSPHPWTLPPIDQRLAANMATNSLTRAILSHRPMPLNIQGNTALQHLLQQQQRQPPANCTLPGQLLSNGPRPLEGSSGSLEGQSPASLLHRQSTVQSTQTAELLRNLFGASQASSHKIVNTNVDQGE